MNGAPTRHRVLGALAAVPIAFALFGTSLAATASGALPDNRVYEQVSEVNKAGQDAGPVHTVGTTNPRTTLFVATTDEGDRLIYGSYGSFAGSLTGFPSSYLARRTSRGWISSAISPGVVEAGNAPEMMNASADLSTTTISFGSSEAMGIEGQGRGLYRGLPDGSFMKMSGDPSAFATYRGGSLDGSHHIFESTEQLIPGVPAPSNAFAPRLYEWIDGQLRLVDRMPGSNLPSTYGANGGGGGAGIGLSMGAARHAISEDGSRIAFISPGTGQSTVGNRSRLYLRIDGERTVEVSRSRCNRTAPDPVCNAPAVISYHDAALDGSKILFTTAEQLLNEDIDAVSDLYSYDVDEDSLTRLSAGVGGATSVLGSSADGEIVYFAAVSNRRIYISKDGAAPQLVALTTGAVPNAAVCPAGAVNVNRDGSVLTFLTSTPGEDSDGDPLPTGLYRYDAEGAGELTLVAAGTDHILKSQSCFRLRYAGLSEDGETIVFQSTQKLVPEDRNNSYDVYRWHDGELALISGGTGDDSRFLLMTPDAKDIFFTTWDQLTPTDTDAAQDIYTARVAGGITPPPVPIHCSDDDCQGPATSAPGGPAVGSAAFGGNGNARPAAPTRKASLRIASRKRVTGVSSTLRVRVPGAGRIAVSGAAVRKVRRAAPKAGNYKLRVTLTPKAKRQLAKRKSLRVGLRLTYRSEDGQSVSRRVLVRFQQPSGKRAMAVKGGR